ncbi:hypothetical protein [Jiangella anatolica]|nr:hypothetical protein [Jiangella anatolica]
MRFDRDVYDRLSDDQKAAYLRAVYDGTPATSEPATRKAAAPEGLEVVEE